MEIDRKKHLEQILKMFFEPWQAKYCDFAVPEELNGITVNSFDELKKYFPDNEMFGQVYKDRFVPYTIGTGYDEYSVQVKIENIKGKAKTSRVAIGCPKCEKITIGVPIVKKENGEFYCKNCQVQLSGNPSFFSKS